MTLFALVRVLKLNNKLYSDKIERAGIFYYLNKTSFSGKWRVNSKGLYNKIENKIIPTSTLPRPQ